MIEQEDQEAEVLLLNRQMLTEVKDLIDDINHTKPSHLRTRTEEDQEAEVMLLNREMITEIKNLKAYRNEPKPSHLKQFMHPQWGSIVGSEEDIRLAALQDEVDMGTTRGKEP